MNDNLKIYNLQQGDLQKWNNYLHQSQDSNYYQLIEWQLINQKHFKHKIYNYIAEVKGKIVGVLPVVSIDSIIFGKIHCSMPFVNYGACCADNADIENKLIGYACENTIKDNAKYLEIRSKRTSNIGLLESTHKISLVIQLNKDSEILWNAFKSKHRTNIRRVYKNGVNVIKGADELLPDFYAVLSRSWRDLGTPIYSIEYFSQILRTFKGNCTIFVAYKGGVPIAAALNGYYKSTVEGMWLGVDNNYRKYQPSYVLYWEMIKDACDRGCSIFHLGRSSVDSGGESFKKKWNAEVQQLYWQYKLNKISELPSLNPSNPKYKLVIKIWSKLPLKLTQLIGPVISKYIP